MAIIGRNQAASILFTSLTNSRRWTGLASTLAFFGASESEFSATAAKPVMNNGMSILGIGIYWQYVVKGIVLLAAVYVDVYQKNNG